MFAQRLRLARKRAGLTMQALADRTTPSVSAQAISKYEANKMMPSSSVLVGLGEALGVSFDFLLGGQVKALKSVEWRKNATASAKDRAMAEVVVIERLENYFAIETILDLEPPEDPFAELRGDQIADEQAIDAKARKVRKAWKIGINPIPSMTDLLENKGIKVIEADLPEQIGGLTCRVERAAGPPSDVILVSQHSNVERKRFNLAHELAHLVLNEDCGALRKEQAMNRFAGAFLVPREDLEEQAGKDRHYMMRNEIMQIKRRYGVSAAAILLRLGQAGILPDSTVEQAFKTYARVWRREEPEPIKPCEGFAALEKPQRFERLVWQAISERMISPVRAAQMLGQPLSSVERDIRRSRDP